MTRLNANKSSSVDGYLRLIDNSPEEYQRLIDTLTVNVSRFFRDEEVYRQIQKIIASAVKEKYKKGQRVFRVWSAGCSTGEEPYSIAAILYNETKKYDANWLLSVHATDVDKNCLNFAKEAAYPIERAIEFPEYYRKSSIDLNEKHFYIKPEIRKLIRLREANLFSPNNIKFFDLILCRNVMIYFSPSDHSKLYEIFYDALNTRGIFIIGRSEKLLHKGNKYFERYDAKNSIYRKRRT